MTRRILSIAAVLACASVVQPARAQCATDLDASGDTGFGDLLSVLSSWGDCRDCPADLSGDGDVGLVDLLEVLAAWGQCVMFECPLPLANREFEQIGLEAMGPDGGLTLPTDIYERIGRDVMTIRAEHGLDGYLHTCEWVGREMLLVLDPDGPLDDYEAMNEFYGATVVSSWFGGTILRLGFPCDLNMAALAALYEAETEVESASPNGIAGGASNRWRPSALSDGMWQWIVTVSFHDCFDGCDCSKQFTFVSELDGSVALVDETAVVGFSWCADEIPGPPGPDVVESWELLCHY